MSFNVLHSSQETKNIFSKPPRVIFKRPPNLKNMLVNTDLVKKAEGGNKTNKCRPCKKPRCGTCKIMTPSNMFESNTTKKKYKIKGDMDCNSKNVIYQLNCKHCDKQYVGQTSNNLRIRITGHRASIVHKENEKPVAVHASFHKKEKIEECYSLKAISKVAENCNKNVNSINLRKTELAHQLVLQTRCPFGLNLR